MITAYTLTAAARKFEKAKTTLNRSYDEAVQERNEVIRQAHKEGAMNYEQIGEHTGLHKSRIAQIVTETDRVTDGGSAWAGRRAGLKGRK